MINMWLVCGVSCAGKTSFIGSSEFRDIHRLDDPVIIARDEHFKHGRRMEYPCIFHACLAKDASVDEHLKQVLTYTIRTVVLFIICSPGILWERWNQRMKNKNPKPLWFIGDALQKWDLGFLRKQYETAFELVEQIGLPYFILDSSNKDYRLITKQAALNLYKE